jgi:hypothetical protein
MAGPDRRRANSTKLLNLNSSYLRYPRDRFNELCTSQLTTCFLARDRSTCRYNKDAGEVLSRYRRRYQYERQGTCRKASNTKRDILD